MSQLSKNLRHLRHISDCTQEEFAQILGIKRSSLGAYEEGRANPNFAVMTQICKMFGITLEQLMSVDISTLNISPIKVAEKVAISVESTTDEPLSEEILEVLHKEEIHTEKSEIEAKSDWRALEKEKVTPETKKIRREEKYEEVREKFYPTLDDGLFSEENQTEFFTETDKGDIPFVKQNNLINYLAHYTDKKFIENLPKIQISLLPKNQEYRAFEMDKSFPLEKSICIGSYLKNWYNVQTGETYLFLTQKQGLIYGKAENRLRNEGYIAVTGFSQQYKVYLREIFEIWQFQLFLSAGKIENL
ncbi:MAG: helix-turn-helix domain-containing protein [Raineya sp.]|nr:helix-turn-helix domain-containing protein [Raineya sp.]